MSKMPTIVQMSPERGMTYLSFFGTTQIPRCGPWQTL